MFVDHFDWEVPLYQVVDEVLSEDACASLIAKVTAQTWLPATVNGPDGRYLNEKLRDNDLALLEDEDLRQAIALVGSSGALADTMERARLYARRAIDALAPFPGGRAKAAMVEAAEFAVARSY